MPTTRGLYESVTASIINELEKGCRPWTKGWRDRGNVRIPTNAATGRPYSGMNILLLWQQSLLKGYATHRWMTFKQANDLKARVKKGEKSCTVVYTSFKPREVDDGNGGTETRSVPLLKAYSVFNVDQLEGLPAVYQAEPQSLPDDEKLDRIREMVTASGIAVQYGATDQPAYYPAPDKVMMPAYSAFNSDHDFVSTLSHELVHATGHEKRLGRKFSPRIFKEATAAEELVAELASAFLCAHFGYSYIEAQSPAYLESWLRVLKADNRAIFSIASYASQAADWLLQKGQGVDETTPAVETHKDDMADAIPY